MVKPRQRQLLQPRVKIWLELDGKYAFGQGIAEILEGVNETGSIKEAAKLLGKSYRYVWGRVKEAETALGQNLVDAQVGGTGTHRSSLTPLASRLLADFQQLRSRMRRLLEEEFAGKF